MKAIEVSSHAGISLKNVLFATDFSGASEAALPYAAAISLRYGSHLHMVHVMSALSYITPSKPVGVLTVESMRQAALEDARERMKNLTSQIETVPHHTYIREGEVWDTLADIIKTHDIDLLVLGTHGRVGVEKFVLGSKAEEILRSATCPVLTVGPKVLPVAKVTGIKGERKHS